MAKTNGQAAAARRVAAPATQRKGRRSAASALRSIFRIRLTTFQGPQVKISGIRANRAAKATTSNTSGDENHQDHFPFLKLPAELRKVIYSMACAVEAPIFLQNSDKKSSIMRGSKDPNSKLPSMLSICRQIRNECLGICVRENAFRVDANRQRTRPYTQTDHKLPSAAEEWFSSISELSRCVQSAYFCINTPTFRDSSLNIFSVDGGSIIVKSPLSIAVEVKSTNGEF